MNKITQVNLNGRAYQLEDQAYRELHDYLKHAEATLSDNPDKKEIVSDLEQAIAEKCERVLTEAKNVIITEEVAKILKQMGPVESDEAEPKEEAARPSAQQPKRLFVIPKGAVLVGVCNGVAAYFGADPMIVRIIFIALAGLTGGAWIVVYIVLALVLPYAKTKEDLAEAYGKPVTAQEIIDRAALHAPNPEAISRVAAAALKVGRVVFEILHIVAAVLFGIVTAAWIIAMWTLLFGNLHLYEQLATISTWEEGALITAIYFAISLPLLICSRICHRIASNRRQSRRSAISEGALAVVWGIALAGVASFAIGFHGPARDYVNSHRGYLDIGNSHICIDESLCNPESIRELPAAPPEPIMVPQ
ncbi:MAG TPA: PspC domain-containing protein [Candidatus Saccharimonadales bacterium]|nr:PspC domain-containing protein [Candidatus Saccharimonadales bacterium]